MPLSLAIPIGFVIALIGAVLLVPARSRKVGVLVLGAGLAIAFFTFVVIVLAVNSQM